MCYCALLLIFDTINALPTSFSFSSYHFLVGMIFDIVGDFEIRLLFPLGDIFQPLNLQPAYIIQYIASCILGAKSAFPAASSIPIIRIPS
jgi:hypothetical protein